MNRNNSTPGTASKLQESNNPNSNAPSKNAQSPTSASSAATNLSNTMVATNESIKIIAESIGITNLSDEGSRDLASDLTFIIKSILIDAQKFARKSRRKKVITSDIDYSLKARSFEPIYGFQSMINDTVPFRCATSTGGNGGGRSIFYTEEQTIDLTELIATNQNIKIPNDFVIHAHWLVIEGIQPSVPENPQLVTKEMQKKEAIEGTSAKVKDLTKQPNQKQSENLVKLKSLIPHDLSVEQQIYFKEVTEACVGSDEQKRTEALNSLSTDPGLHQLLPRIILFISEGVRLNIIQLNMAILIYLMRMAKSLCENKSIYLEKYLHELLPSVLSCVLSKQLCSRPEIDNHCALREFCARLVGQIVKTYSPTIPSLQTRTIKIYLNSLQSEKTTFATLFGAISGISELGNEICESFIFPLVKNIGERIVQILDGTTTSQEKLPAEKVKQQLIRSISTILKSRQTQNEYDYLLSEFGAYFGPLIHAQLMKLRNQQQCVNQAQLSANVNKQYVISSQNTRTSPSNQFKINTSITLNHHNASINQPPITSSETIATVYHQIEPLTSNKAVSLVDASNNRIQIGNNTVSPINSATNNLIQINNKNNNNIENLSFDSKDNDDKLSEDSMNMNDISLNGDDSSALRSTSTTITTNIGVSDNNMNKLHHNPINLNDLKNSNLNFEFIKTDSIENLPDVNVSMGNIFNENNPINLSNATSDSNNTNNMTTSDVNLSDTIEASNEPHLN